MMKRKNLIWMLLVAFVASSVFIACEKDDDDDDDNNKQDDPSGAIHVYVRKDNPTGVYWGYALVKIYESTDDRKNDVVYDSNYTAGKLPFNAGFYDLPLQRFYIRASFEYQGDYYQGDGDVLVTRGDTTSIHVTAKPK